jgi:hypothetical protein
MIRNLPSTTRSSTRISGRGNIWVLGSICPLLRGHPNLTLTRYLARLISIYEYTARSRWAWSIPSQGKERNKGIRPSTPFCLRVPSLCLHDVVLISGFFFHLVYLHFQSIPSLVFCLVDHIHIDWNDLQHPYLSSIILNSISKQRYSISEG